MLPLPPPPSLPFTSALVALYLSLSSSSSPYNAPIQASIAPSSMHGNEILITPTSFLCAFECGINTDTNIHASSTFIVRTWIASVWMLSFLSVFFQREKIPSYMRPNSRLARCEIYIRFIVVIFTWVTGSCVFIWHSAKFYFRSVAIPR